MHLDVFWCGRIGIRVETVRPARFFPWFACCAPTYCTSIAVLEQALFHLIELCSDPCAINISKWYPFAYSNMLPLNCRLTFKGSSQTRLWCSVTLIIVVSPLSISDGGLGFQVNFVANDSNSWSEPTKAGMSSQWCWFSILFALCVWGCFAERQSGACGRIKRMGLNVSNFRKHEFFKKKHCLVFDVFQIFFAVCWRWLWDKNQWVACSQEDLQDQLELQKSQRNNSSSPAARKPDETSLEPPSKRSRGWKSSVLRWIADWNRKVFVCKVISA